MDPVHSFGRSQLELLKAELAAETESTTSLLETASPKALARAGLAVLNLIVASQRTGLGGRTVFELGKDPAVSTEAEIGEHGIRTGDIVRAGPQPKGGERKKEKAGKESKGVEGVVVKTTRTSIQVAVDGDEGVEGRIWVVKLANEVTYKRMNIMMNKLVKLTEGESSGLIQVLFGLTKPTKPPADLENEETGAGNVEFFDETLNDSQRSAVKFALASREVALIHGPPGVVYLLEEETLLERKLRVLVCGPSNISVDNIVERLSPYKIPIVRLGHPARLLPSVLSHSLDFLTETSDGAALVKDIRKEMDAKQASVRKTKSGRERHAIYGELRELRKDFRERERNCIRALVGQSKVVLATLHGAGSTQLFNEKFDVVIIDEASQALEAQCWIPLFAATKVVLAGDHLQLPPTVKSNDSTHKSTKGSSDSKDPKDATTAAKLEFTLFDRLLVLFGPSVKRMLTTQYRMHEKIMEFPAKELYEAKLTAADSVKSRLLKDLPYDVEETDDTREPLVYWDTQGRDFPEQNEEDSENVKRSVLRDSKSNAMEAMLVEHHVTALVKAGVHPEDIAVVTPYNAQRSLISQQIKEKFPGLELGSVDGFQGREKEAIILSLVRSNDEHEVGFLAEKRRLNVAMTRPKRHLCVIGDSETVGRGGKFLKRWIAYLEEDADLRYPNVADLT